MRLELGSRFRLPDGRLVEVVPDISEILKLNRRLGPCSRCEAFMLSYYDCVAIGCLDLTTSTLELANGYPRILREVENEQPKG